MKQTATAVTATLLAGLLGFVISPFTHDLWSFGADTFLPKLSRQGQLSLVVTLAILCLVLGVLLYRSYSQKLLLRKYEYFEKRGFWVHRKTGQRVCGNCLISGIESPLACCSFLYPNGQFQRNAWVCSRKMCKMEYCYEQGDTKDDA